MKRMPQTRRSGLIVKEVDGEILIYDQETNQAHCLNPSAAKVWKYCDGQTTVAHAARSLSGELDATIDEKFVLFALDQFSRDGLLEEKIQLPAFMADGMNRRQMVRALGLAAVIAVPLVSTIVAPTPAQAATLGAPGAACCTGAECQSGICTGASSPCPPQGTCA